MKVNIVIPAGWRKLRAGTKTKEGDKWLLPLMYNDKQEADIKTWKNVGKVFVVGHVVRKRAKYEWPIPFIRKVNKPNK